MSITEAKPLLVGEQEFKRSLQITPDTSEEMAKLLGLDSFYNSSAVNEVLSFQSLEALCLRMGAFSAIYGRMVPGVVIFGKHSDRALGSIGRATLPESICKAKVVSFDSASGKTIMETVVKNGRRMLSKGGSVLVIDRLALAPEKRKALAEEARDKPAFNGDVQWAKIPDIEGAEWQGLQRGRRFLQREHVMGNRAIAQMMNLSGDDQDLHNPYAFVEIGPDEYPRFNKQGRVEVYYSERKRFEADISYGELTRFQGTISHGVGSLWLAAGDMLSELSGLIGGKQVIEFVSVEAVFRGPVGVGKTLEVVNWVSEIDSQQRMIKVGSASFTDDGPAVKAEFGIRLGKLGRNGRVHLN